MASFQIINPDTATTEARGTEYTVTRRPDGSFRVFVVNAMVKAYRRGLATGRDFATLAEVENAYKGLQGISGAFEAGS